MMSVNTAKILRPKKSVVELPHIDTFYIIAQETLVGIPERFREMAKDIEIVIENFADSETLETLDIENKYDLLGLYRGVPYHSKSLTSLFTLPDKIFLYRCPLIRYARENKEDLNELVRHVLIHEMGHHFGCRDYDKPLN
jgi:predicted Zn-dependent protease with MMP-like domain